MQYLLCQDLQSDVSHRSRVADNVASTREEQVDVLVQLPCAAEVECNVGAAAAFFRRIAEQLETKRQPLGNLTFKDRACVKVIACFGGGLPPKADIAIERPFLPTFLRNNWQHERRPALPKAARIIACRQQQLRIGA